MHTKRVPLWIPFDPGADDAEALRRAHRASAPAPTATTTARTSSATATTRRSGRPRRARHRRSSTSASSAAGTSTKAPRLSRDLYHRAIEVMAGAHALDGFISLDADESFAVEYWPLELYKLSQAPPPGELQGQVALVTGAAGGIGRAVVDALAGAGACVVGFDLDEEGAAGRGSATTGSASAGDVTSEEAVARRVRARPSTRSAASTWSSPTRASRPARRSRRRRWPSGTATTRSSAPATSSSRARRSGCCAGRARGGVVVFVASKNALVAGKNAAAYSSAKAAELHLARCLAEEGGAAGIRVNTVNPDAVLQGSRIWGSSWREERAAAYGIEPGRARGALPQAHHARREHPAGGHRRGGDALRLAARARGRPRVTSSTWTEGVPAAYPR